MYDEERDAYTDTFQSAPGLIYWAVWLAWVVATYLGFTLGESLGRFEEQIFAPEMLGLPRALSLEWYVGAGGGSHLLVAIASGFMAGAVLGIAQGLVLFPFLRLSGALEWVGATAIGMAIAWGAHYQISREIVGLVADKYLPGPFVVLVFLVGVGVIVGMALGYPQAIVLRRRVEHASWWLLGVMAGPVLLALLLTMTLFVAVENTLRDYGTGIIALLTGVITGRALVELLHRPRMQAEWLRRLRRRPERAPRREDTVLGSTLYAPRPSASGEQPDLGQGTKAE